jgi:hypothetical protein
MKYSYITFLILISSFSIAIAQPGEGGRDKIRAYQVAFFTQKLDLTADEAKGFWPLYNAYREEFRTLQKEQRRSMSASNNDNSTDAELEKIISKRFEIEQQKLDLEKSYYLKFKKALPMRKVAKLPQVEKAFKASLLKEMKNKRKNKG